MSKHRDNRERWKAVIAITTFLILAAAELAAIYWWAYCWIPWADEMVNRAFGV